MSAPQRAVGGVRNSHERGLGQGAESLEAQGSECAEMKKIGAEREKKSNSQITEKIVALFCWADCSI